MNLNDLPEEILEEIYRHVFIHSLKKIINIKNCVSCDTCLPSQFSPCKNTICDYCLGQVCLECSLRMRNFGRGYQTMNGKCYKCRKIINGVNNVVCFKNIGSGFKISHN